MKSFSLRTLMLTVLGVSLLCALFTTRGWNAGLAHLLLVLAFAAPAGSWAFDRRGTHRSAVVGTCLGAVLGTACISGLVLALDLIWLIG